MKHTPENIYNEYLSGYEFKSALGNRGLYEQSRINERFYIGDQWHGAKCGNERPLVRHNVIKRIGDYKISQIMSNKPSVSFSAQGIPTKNSAVNENTAFAGAVSEEEINYILSAFGNYYNVTAERVKLSELNERMLRNAYICGTSVLYTYWDSSVPTGLFADSKKTVGIAGDICCEVLDIDDVVFGDPYCETVQNQPYIIIASRRDTEEVLREARLYGADLTTLKIISESEQDGKVNLYTKLYKEFDISGGSIVKAVKVTEKAVVRKPFNTMLKNYPVSIFCWERKNNSIYGESEITYLIPNQIAINRMITANVWSAMTTGMPMMVVNGDTVTDKITNDPGQIIKVFGSNEDVAGAVKYVTPPVFSEAFDKSINTLIENTLTQSGANEVALGDSKADNATALITMRDAALMPLQIVKNRYYTFLEDTARIWADFWVSYYGKRSLKQSDKTGSRYIPFDAERYKSLAFCAKVEVGNDVIYSEKEKTQMLIHLFEKGIINRKQLLERLPEGIVANIGALITDDLKEEEV